MHVENAIRDGWLFTGDAAQMDKEGYIFIVDRKNDMIIASDFNIYPREIEEVLYQALLAPQNQRGSYCRHP